MHPRGDDNLKGMMANNSKTTKLDRQIDENLRRVYSDLSEEPLPDRFSQLLEKLRKQEEAKTGAPKPEGDA